MSITGNQVALNQGQDGDLARGQPGSGRALREEAQSGDCVRSGVRLVALWTLGEDGALAAPAWPASLGQGSGRKKGRPVVSGRPELLGNHQSVC